MGAYFIQTSRFLNPRVGSLLHSVSSPHLSSFPFFCRKGDRSFHTRYEKGALPDATILEASDGDEALHLAQRYLLRLIISDYSLPKMSGLQFLKALRRESQTRDIPVLIVTGYGSGAAREALMDAGAVGIMSKPVSVAQFKKTVKKSISVNW